MDSNEKGAPLAENAPARSGGPEQSVPKRTGIEALHALPTSDLKKLISKLEIAYTAASDLPDVFSDYDDLITAAATARRVLKVRLARQRIAEARQMLDDLGRPA